MNNNSTSEANPSGLEGLNGQEGERTEVKHMNSTGTGGEGGREEAVTGKDWRLDPFVSSDELITGDDQGGLGARSGEGGLKMESQERISVIGGVGDVTLSPPLSYQPGFDSVRGKGRPQVRESSENCHAMNEVWRCFDYIAIVFFFFVWFPIELASNDTGGCTR